MGVIITYALQLALATYFHFVPLSSSTTPDGTTIKIFKGVGLSVDAIPILGFVGIISPINAYLVRVDLRDGSKVSLILDVYPEGGADRLGWDYAENNLSEN